MAEMAEIEVAWIWRSTSPLHVGSGLSRPGVADSLVQRDREGNAVIHGDAVKGALRMSAEQIAAWMGAPKEELEERYAEQGNAEPRLWPLARLFGGDATAGCTARCTPAKIVEQDDEKADAKARQVFAATAINRDTGVARDKTLRKTEIVPPGLRFSASYRASVAYDEDEVNTIETLLLAALASVDSIGGKAGIGWGRVALDKVTVTVGGKERCQIEAVSAQRLKKLQSALKKTPEGNAVTDSTATDPAEFKSCEQLDLAERDGPGSVGAMGSVAAASVASAPAPAAGVASASNATSPASCRWFMLTITLEEPTCLPGLPEISNKVTTHDWIAATTLRGALAARWRRDGRTDDEISSWLSEGTRWTPGFRVATEGGALVLPAPRSFITTKRATGGARRLHDALSGAPPRRAADGTELQWRPAGDIAMWWDGECAKLDEGGGLRETQMHVARNYLTRGKRSGALYARESLAPGTTFVAWAHVPPSAFRNREQQPVETLTLLLGKRVSAGNGQATVCVEESAAGPEYSTAAAAQSGTGGDAASVVANAGAEGNPRSVGQEVAQDPQGAGDVFVHLLCPALVYDEMGYPLRTLDADWWGRAFDAKLEPSSGAADADAYTGPGRRGGWMTSWKHPRAAVGTIEAGSVWRLRCTSTEDAKVLRAKLRKEGCIGERVHEGFGWIAVDPPWLGKRPDDRTPSADTTLSEPASAASAAPVDAPAPPQANGEPTSWPGVEMGAPTLAGLAHDLANESPPEEAGPAFREIAARVRATAMEEAREFATYLDELRKLCRLRAQRKAARWKPVENTLGKPWTGYQPLLFALDMLAKRAAGTGE